MPTKGEMLSFQIAYQLRGVRLQYGKRFMKLGMTEQERYAAADRVIEQLRDRGGGWEWLDDPAVSENDTSWKPSTR